MKRIASLDLARGFTVLFIPAIHSVMCYSRPYVYTTWLGYPLQFIAEGPGAQLFMTIMGIVFTFRKNYSHQQIGLRALVLAVAGYLLNVFKFIIPYSFGVLPTGVKRALHLNDGTTAVLQLLGIGDILQFAAIALLVMHGLYRLKNYQRWALTLATIFACISPLLWDLHVNNPVVNYLLELLGGGPPRVFFPVFPWLVYPLLGIFIGKYLQEWPRRTFERCATVGIALLFAGITIAKLFHEHSAAGFYRTLPGETLMHIGVVLITLFIWHHLSIQIKPNAFFQLIAFCSRTITVFYIIQWILICWLLPIIGYQTLGVAGSMIMCVCATIFSLSIIYLYERFAHL